MEPIAGSVFPVGFAPGIFARTLAFERVFLVNFGRDLRRTAALIALVGAVGFGTVIPSPAARLSSIMIGATPAA